MVLLRRKDFRCVFTKGKKLDDVWPEIGLTWKCSMPQSSLPGLTFALIRDCNDGYHAHSPLIQPSDYQQ